MRSNRRKNSVAGQLRALAADPDEQTAFAVSLLRPGESQDVILAALTALKDRPPAEARQPLVELYRSFAQQGMKRDPGGGLRAEVLKTLIPVALGSEAPLFVEATSTYEFLPPSFEEGAHALRAAGLLGLYELNEELTCYFAAGMLTDSFTSRMSGEPAVTAVRVLAALGELPLLYQRVMQAPGAGPEEVYAECLRNLTKIPPELLPSIARVAGSYASPSVRASLFDLLLDHDSGPQELDVIAAYLAAPEDLDVYRYLIIKALMTGDDRVKRLVLSGAQHEQSNERLSVLLEALAPYASDPAVREIVDTLAGR